ncbi:RES domain-containing protein [Sphingomonas melonis]|uniref:RES domain-containing protein n=2 Tax=Sphingomonas melonis TaxID=152682 RepID=A0A7Y9K1K5_9SPHN|nr:RES domain-containing protein [Sphingomonas melonis]
MSLSEPEVRTVGYLSTVRGRFFRAVVPGYEQNALSGSVRAGRYSRPHQPTLYLSSSEAGVTAAMMAHAGLTDRWHVLQFDVNAADVFDLRASRALDEVRRKAGDPLSAWQEIAEHGGEPASWHARDWIESIGAKGLIDPSRKVPGLWHLVLFSWNVPGSPIVS